MLESFENFRIFLIKFRNGLGCLEKYTWFFTLIVFNKKFFTNHMLLINNAVCSNSNLPPENYIQNTLQMITNLFRILPRSIKLLQFF